MSTEPQPKIGELYSCEEQHEMHGGELRPTLPIHNGQIPLIRFRPELNPNGPYVIEHGETGYLWDCLSILEKQDEALPVYERISNAQWKFLGYFRVVSITSNPRIVAARSRIAGRPVVVVISLVEATS